MAVLLLLMCMSRMKFSCDICTVKERAHRTLACWARAVNAGAQGATDDRQRDSSKIAECAAKPTTTTPERVREGQR